MTSYESYSLVISIIAIMLTILIPLAQFLYRKFRKPKLDLIPFDGPSLSICFNESGSYAELKFSIASMNADSLVRTIELIVKNCDTGKAISHKWTSMKPIHMNWMNSGFQQAVLNTATYVHPIKVEEEKAEPFYIEFASDVDAKFNNLLRERDELLLTLCEQETSIEGILLRPEMQDLIGKIRGACFWHVGEHELELRASYDANRVCSRRYSVRLSENDVSRILDNASGIATCRIPQTISGDRPSIQPFMFSVEEVK